MLVNIRFGKAPIAHCCTLILNIFKVIKYERAFMFICIDALPLFDAHFPGSTATLAHGSIDVYLFTVYLMLLSCISHSIPSRL